MAHYLDSAFFVIVFAALDSIHSGTGVSAIGMAQVRILTHSESGNDAEFQGTNPVFGVDEYYVSNKTSKILTGPSSNRRPPYGNMGGNGDLSPVGSGHTESIQSHPSISPIDMQLLGAMEKLVGRMDAMDKRVKTVESIVHFLTEKDKSTVNTKPSTQRGNCPPHFENVDGIKGKCYHVSSFAKPPTVTDWKTAAAECFKLGGRFAEILTYSDFHRISTFLVKHANIRTSASTDFWTGGLNPGLIWIWSESGQQVDLDKRYWNENDNGSNAPGCLKLSYSVRLDTFFFKGAPCSQAQNFICEILDNSVARALADFEKNLIGKEGEGEDSEEEHENENSS